MSPRGNYQCMCTTRRGFQGEFDTRILKIAIILAAGGNLREIELHWQLNRLALGCLRGLTVGIDERRLPRESQRLITRTAPVGHQREHLVLHRPRGNGAAVDRAVRIHVAIGDDQQVRA